jgi:hypothetical protein
MCSLPLCSPPLPHACGRMARVKRAMQSGVAQRGVLARMVIVVVALCGSVRRRSIISQRWSPFCAIVVRQQVIVKWLLGPVEEWRAQLSSV